MGNEKKEGVVKQLEDMLGLGEDTSTVDNVQTKEATPKDGEASKEDTSKDTLAQTPNTTVVTDEQVLITKDIAKIDLQIEALESETVDTDKFFENIEENLSEEEQTLEHSDRPAYMKLINTKAKEYEESNSNAQAIQTLKNEKQEKESVYERQSAITEVIAKYPSYKHEDVLEFFQKELSETQQQKIIDSSSSYSDVYEGAYKKFLELNPSNIETQAVTHLPNMNNIRKQPLETSDVEDSLQGDDDKIREALGL